MNMSSRPSPLPPPPRPPGWSAAPPGAEEQRWFNARVLDRITALWQNGWEPLDLFRAVESCLGPAHVDLLRDAVAAELDRYPPDTVPRHWSTQLAQLGISVHWPSDRTWLTADQRRTWSTTVERLDMLTQIMTFLPRLPLSGPVPGSARPGRAARPDVDERVLAKVRALLAKAESTSYPAEAETFTAGAQAMMARHSIDRALLDASAAALGSATSPSSRRIRLESPYEKAKSILLYGVAQANRCKSMWTKAYGFCTVVGYETDLDAVELLFTSLLVQATTAMMREGSKQDEFGRSRTRMFRQTFLVAYAHRIHERLADTTAEQTRQAASEQALAAGAGSGSPTTGASPAPAHEDLLPVLAAREAAVDAVIQELFPRVTTRRSRLTVDDVEGWAKGRAAADLAHLAPAQPLSGPAEP